MKTGHFLVVMPPFKIGTECLLAWPTKHQLQRVLFLNTFLPFNSVMIPKFPSNYNYQKAWFYEHDGWTDSYRWHTHGAPGSFGLKQGTAWSHRDFFVISLYWGDCISRTPIVCPFWRSGTKTTDLIPASSCLSKRGRFSALDHLSLIDVLGSSGSLSGETSHNGFPLQNVKAATNGRFVWGEMMVNK